MNRGRKLEAQSTWGSSVRRPPASCGPAVGLAAHWRGIKANVLDASSLLKLLELDWRGPIE